MIEEILSAPLQPTTLKILTADKEIMDRLPAIDSYISFQPFIDFLKEKLVYTSGTRADFYRYMIRKFEAEPNLLQQVLEAETLANYDELLELLSTAIFPVVSEKHNFTLSAPYQFRIFSYSDSFKKLFVHKDESGLKLPDEISEQTLREVQCSMIYDHILEKYYGIKLNDSPELVYPVTDEGTGMKKYYRMRYDRRFIEVNLKGDLPPIKDCAVCLNTFRILDLEHQLKTMPLELFEVKGFAVWIAEDVTAAHALEQIKQILLRYEHCSTEFLNELKEPVLALVGLNNISVGLMPFVKINNNFLLNEDCSGNSLVGKYWRSNDEASEAAFKGFIEFQHNMPEPMPVSNLNEEMMGFAPFMRPVYNDGIRSYISYPMQHDDGLLGFLELGSPVPNQLDTEIMARLEPAIPLLSVAMLKARNTFNDKIDKLVKEKFTALQPSVEWKFSEVAWDFLKNKGSANGETGKIIFENVYPLYGAIDIRNSSVERNTCIQKDLVAHANLVSETIDKLQEVIPLTLLEELKFKNSNFLQAFDNIRLPEDEVRFNEFLENEAHPVFTHLQKNNAAVVPIVEYYTSLETDPEGTLFRNRKNFEESLGTINQAVLRYLESNEEQLQRSYPHYFEKFRTDGVEYNIFIGQSMAPAIPFDVLYLKNIRLWQLQSMAELARITQALVPELKVPLQTTQIILVHSQPISISFRKDERRFDVEGSYNIRYEVMKKRIDKALVLGTNERLTQPGTIALVYSQQKEAQEYEEYIRFLQGKGLLQPGVEFLDLAELQGLKGLKALRVRVNLV